MHVYSYSANSWGEGLGRDDDTTQFPMQLARLLQHSNMRSDCALILPSIQKG